MAENDVERAHALVLQYGWNSTCYQIVNPGITRWFSSAGDAVVGYVRRYGVRVVAGAPVCRLARLTEVVREFEAGERGPICYFGAEERMCVLTEPDPKYSRVVLGAQPIWRPECWPERFDSDKSLRAQVNRARNKRVEICEWPAEKATNHPALRRCLNEWLCTRGLPPMHFLVEPETLDRLEGRRVFVAEMGGEAVGFTVLSPAPRRHGWLTEQFVRGAKAPNGTIELLIDTAVRTVAAEGSEYVTMGIVPLSNHGFKESQSNPPWLRAVMAWSRAHGRRFYNFDGLDWFKSKFHPEHWEPIYALSNEPNFSPRTLLAIAAAFSGDRSPFTALLGGLVRAVRQEISWLAHPQRRGG